MQGVDTPHLILKPLDEPDISLLRSPACTICTTPPRYWSLLRGPSKPYNHELPLGYILEVFQDILIADVWTIFRSPCPISNLLYWYANLKVLSMSTAIQSLR